MYSEQDYLTRVIHEMVRAFVKLVFHKEIDPALPFQIEQESPLAKEYDVLIEMVEEGSVNEAENRLMEELQKGSREQFEMAILFYNYLNEKETDFLEGCNFSREEVAQGLKDAAKKCGYGSLAKAFLSEE